MEEYLKLLGSYHGVVNNGQWWAGQRARLAEAMDRVWALMNPSEREAALRHAEELWDKRGGR